MAVQCAGVTALAAMLVLTPVGTLANGETRVRAHASATGGGIVAIESADAETERRAADAIIDAAGADAGPDTATADVARAGIVAGDAATTESPTSVGGVAPAVDRAASGGVDSAGAGAGGAVVASATGMSAPTGPVAPAEDRTAALAASIEASAPAPLGTGGSVVRVEGSGYRFTYRVNGEPTVIQGMGYNPWYATLPTEERQRRYERDFARMRAIGVNTIEGWFQDQFDRVTLDAAHANGLGVIMPFELNQDYDYADPAVRESFRAQVTAWVLRYKDHPAVRMWGPGNENLHRLIFPTVLKGQQDPAMEARADAFAAFYVELADLVHELDPNHPVVYRDAEDLYFRRIRDALLRDGKARPWFVYGTNTYTPRLEEVIRQWPSQGLDVPLLVSEFSPGGVAPADRPHMFGAFWSMIRARPDMVLGGVVYTWATEGPEDLDRIFGLTDPDGRPVDGSLVALRRLFLKEGTDEGGQ